MIHTWIRYGTSGRKFIDMRRGERLSGEIRFFNYKGHDLAYRATNVDLSVIDEVLFRDAYRGFGVQWRCLQNYHKHLVANHKTPLIIDCGAHIGTASRWFSSAFPCSRVVALEPENGNYALLEKNAEIINRASSQEIVAINSGLADQEGTINYFDRGQGSWAFSTIKYKECDVSVGEMSVRGLANILSSEGKGFVPYILKIDIEGAEAAINFTELSSILHKFSLIIIELHDWMFPWSRTSTEFIRFAASANFDFTHKGENVFLYNRDLARWNKPSIDSE